MTNASARDFFEAARAAAFDLTRSLLKIEEMESRNGGSSPIASPRGSGPSDVNGTAQTIAALDMQEAMRARIAEDRALLDLATSVVYGDSESGGVRALAGATQADVLFWRYLSAEPWDTVAQECGISRRTAIRYANMALDLVDAYGILRAASGTGIAQDA